jgi:hypothetical protein
MGDRCHMEIVCRREDAPLFEPEGFAIECGFTLRHGRLHYDSAVSAVSAVVQLGQDEVNYAASVGDGKAGFGDLPMRVPFFGTHGPGGDYGDGVFATLGRRLHYALALHNSAVPAVELDLSTGKLVERQLRAARRYLATLVNVRALLIEHLREHSPGLCAPNEETTR